MNTLYWKEWRENRLIVLWTILLLLVLLTGCVVEVHTDPSAGQFPVVAPETVEGVLYLTWWLSALLCGASMVAQEIGLGTLQFLTALPITRSRIWITKLATMFFLLLLSIGLTTLLYIAFYSVVSHFGSMQHPLSYSFTQIKDHLSEKLAAVVTLFAVGATMTMLVDRPISALFASLVASIALFALIGMTVNAMSLTQDSWVQMSLMALLLVPALLSVSFQTFVRGETLRTSARFRIAAPHFLQSILIVALALVISFFWILS